MRFFLGVGVGVGVGTLDAKIGVFAKDGGG